MTRLCVELRKFSVERPRWGYRRAHHRLRELGWSVNRQRVQRLRAERPNHVWAFDFQFDQIAVFLSSR
jgi:putative transposase